MVETVQIKTLERSAMVDVTDAIARKVQESGIKSGLCLLHVPHTTAGILVNEGADPAVMEKIRRVCQAYVSDPYAQRYHFWSHYADRHQRAIHFRSVSDRQEDRSWLAQHRGFTCSISTCSVASASSSKSWIHFGPLPAGSARAGCSVSTRTPMCSSIGRLSDSATGSPQR